MPNKMTQHWFLFLPFSIHAKSVLALSDNIMVSEEALITVKFHRLAQGHYKEDIAKLLEHNVNLEGDPKLFIVFCPLDCVIELLIQVSGIKY